MNRKGSRRVFVSWTAFSRRSESLAAALNAETLFIECWKNTGVVLLPLRYLRQALETWRWLRSRRPELVMTMNPPIVLPLVAWLYCRLHGARFAVDSHTGAFLGTWGRFLFLHRFLSRRAACTIVTNETLAQRVRDWGARAFVLPIEIPEFPSGLSGSVDGDSHVCVINSFSDDEPLEEILEAASRCSDCRFSITGKIPPQLQESLLAARPSNVRYTGYLPQAEYVELLASADVVVVLVRFDDTMLQGAAEAVAVEKPLVTSDWPVLRDYFSRGTLYVDNTPGSIAAAVREAMERKTELSHEMGELKRTLAHAWQHRCTQLGGLLSVGGKQL